MTEKMVRKPNTLVHVLIYGTDSLRCADCGNVVLLARSPTLFQKYYCVYCNKLRGKKKVYIGDEQTGDEFDSMMDAVYATLKLDG